MNRYRAIATILLSAAFLLAGHGHADALVLCVGTDGHVAVEAAIEGSCASDADPHSANVPPEQEIACGGPHNENHCGACVDIPFELGSADTCHPAIQAGKTILNGPVVGTVPLPATAIENQSTLDSRVQFVELPATTITCLRTVTLLI